MSLAQYVPLMSSGVSSGGGLIGGILANKANAKENQRNREWNEKMWDKTNEYNLPVNQIARFQEAGLNSALVYGQGTSSLASYSGNLGTQRAYENPAKNFHLEGADVVRLKNETKVADSQEYLNNQDAYTKFEEGLSKSIDNEMKLDNIEEYYKAQLGEWKRKFNDGEISAKELEIKQEELNKSIEAVQTQKEITREYRERGNTEIAQQRLLQSESDLKIEQKNTELTVQALNKSAAARNYSEADYYRTQKQLSSELIKKTRDERHLISSQIAINEKTVNKVVSETGLNYAQAQKALEDTRQMILTGDVERYQKIITQRYGTSAWGVLLNVATDIAHKIKKPVGEQIKTEPTISTHSYR